MLKKILLVIAILVVAVLIVAAFQPDDYRVTRSATIAAPPSAVFAQVNDFHRWEAWSPWAKLDPAIKQTYAGAPSGTGAVYAWMGNSKVGEGRMTITDSRPSDLVTVKLEFIKPFASVATSEFTFKPEGNQTAVTWSTSGEKIFVTKVMCLFMSMDKMIGGQFEQGLSQLKAIAEASNKK